jgi:hyperosmotically inducible protein
MEYYIMKQLKWISLIFAAALLTSMAGCASTANKESTGQYIDDSVITTKVKAAIVDDLSLKGFEIKVETYKGEVQLSGFVTSETNIAKATEDARRVEGVKYVKNNMQLK